METILSELRRFVECISEEASRLIRAKDIWLSHNTSGCLNLLKEVPFRTAPRKGSSFYSGRRHGGRGLVTILG